MCLKFKKYCLFQEAFEAYEDSDDDFEPDCDSDDEVHDLSYWHVTIPKIDYVLEKNKKVNSLIQTLTNIKIPLMRLG